MSKIPSPCISIIIPIYNTAPYLRQCLDSVCGQTYPHLEIICVDDGSTDNSPAILDEYAARDSRVKLIRQSNAGVSAARNAGLEAATGEYVTGVDPDDYLELHAYERILSHLDATADIVCFGTVMEDEDKQPLQAEWSRLPAVGRRRAADINLLLINDCFWNKLWRRDFLCSIGVSFPVGLRYEDSAFYHMSAPLAKEWFFVDEQLYHYVRHSCSFMNMHHRWQTNCRYKVDILKIIFRFYEDHHVPTRTFLDLITFYMDAVLYITPLWNKGKVRQAFRCVCLELGLDKNQRYARQYPVMEMLHPLLRWNPFFRRNGYKKSYMLFWLPIFCIQRKHDYTRYKLLGARLYKKRTRHVM